jgi:HEPN domain-containing protein
LLLMDKKKHLDYWLRIAEKDKDMMPYLLEGKRYVQALFFGHLYLEKIAKAVWVKNNVENIPPKTHNLLKIIKEASLDLPAEDQAFLIKLNQYQIESRYPEDVDKLYNITDRQLTEEYFNKISLIEKCLREKMQ